MLYRTACFTFFTLLMTAFVGCDSGPGGDTGDSNAQVTATLTGHGEFSSDDVFATGTAISFSFSAVDGKITLLISIQSPDGEPLPTTSYRIGENTIDGVTYFASGSVVFDNDGTNVVLNAQAGGDGRIILQSFSTERVSGQFGFDAATTEPPPSATEVSAGFFDIKF